MNSFVRVQNLNRESSDPVRVVSCKSFGKRLRGLMFRRELPADQGVLLEGSRESRLDAAIHMLFVGFDLAVFWINSEYEVVDKIVAKPWRAAYFPRRPARYVLELHPEHFSAYEIGHKVKIIDA
jgi:uncharacterized protein